MKNNFVFLGGINRGLLGLLTVLRDDRAFLVTGVLIAALFSSLARGKISAILGFVVFYLSWTTSLFVTAYLIEPRAILGLFMLIFYFPFIAIGYTLALLLLRRLILRKKL